MAKYEIIIYWGEEDQAFIAEVPELAGCMADGKTYQEAIANAEVVTIDTAAMMTINLGGSFMPRTPISLNN